MRRFFLSNVWTRKREGVIYQDRMKRVSGGALISLPVGLFLASKSSTGPPFPLPFGAASLIPLGLIFPRIGKNVLCPAGLFLAGRGFSFSLETACLLNLLGQGFLLLWFCFCPKATLENVVPVGVFFGVKQHWTRCEIEKILGWAGEKFAGWKKNLKNCWWEYLRISHYRYQG